MNGFKKKIFVLVGLLLLIVISMPLFKEWRKKIEIDREIADLEAQARQISESNSEIREKIRYLESRDFQEKQAKDKLGLQNPDENVIIVNPGISRESTGENNQENQNALIEYSEKSSNFAKWWNIFFN